jgi:putative component of toxin-antitoxin plasmid stabilization module
MYTTKEADQFSSWLERLKDIKARRRILLRLRSAQLGDLGDINALTVKYMRCEFMFEKDTDYISPSLVCRLS